LSDTSTPAPADDPLSAAREALARGACAESRRLFLAVLERGETPEALEGLATATWWLGGSADAVRARESAYQLYGAAGNAQGAARVALTLSLAYEDYRGETAVANGWIELARRQLQGLAPSPEHAWLALWEAHHAILFRGDLPTGRRLLGEARRLGRTRAMIDVEMTALGLEGILLVRQGRVAEGMRRLDEAATAALGGEMKDLDAIGQTCRYAISACEQAYDFSRVGQWYRRARQWYVRLQLSPGLPFCRNHYSSVLMWQGEWAEAEAEILAMRSELPDTARVLTGEAVSRLGELRRRQGRREEAALLFAEAESHPRAWLGRAALVLDELASDGGDPGAVVSLVERYFGQLAPEDRLGRAPGLDLLVRALALMKKDESARAAAAELFAIAEAARTDALRALGSAAQGAVAAGAGDHDAARHCFEDALDRFEMTGAPFESGRARLDLARALAALGQTDEAAREARQTLAGFERIGAAGEAGRARRLLEELSSGGPEPEKASALAKLTGRETEVLGLVAQGLSNPEIARRLSIREGTVKRHVATVLAKLNLPSRAAAAAHLARK